jgi:hypothetical protein
MLRSGPSGFVRTTETLTGWSCNVNFTFSKEKKHHHFSQKFHNIKNLIPKWSCSCVCVCVFLQLTSSTLYIQIYV